MDVRKIMLAVLAVFVMFVLFQCKKKGGDKYVSRRKQGVGSPSW
jgi:hypothetical protein